MYAPSKRRKISLMLLCGVLFVLTLPATAQQGGSKPGGGGQGGSKVDNNTQTGDVIRQWASSAEASSEYVGWEAEGATGPADIDECGDIRGAWASEKWDEGVEWWLGYYDTPVIPTQINVHQNFNPGTIVNLVVFPVDSEDPLILENSVDSDASSCPHVFSYDVSGIDVPVDRVGLFIDQSTIKNWTEVDAVELVGAPVGGGSSSAGGPGAGGSSTKGSTTTSPGISVSCPEGGGFDNGVEVIVNMRPGFSYTATVIGVGDFDPIVAVTDGEDTLCNDDNADVRNAQVHLPTTGEIGPSTLSAQMPFTYSGDELGNISFIVGSPDSGAGEFVLLIEGLAVTSADGSGDGAGDPFYLTLGENVVNSGVDITAYMVSVTNDLDSLVYIVNSEDRMFVFDDGTAAACDDAGTTTCYGGESTSLSGYYVTRTNGNKLGGGDFDSFMALPSDVFTAGNFLEYRFSSSQQRTRGDYVAAFHLGTAAAR